MPQLAPYAYPNILGQIFLRGMEEILGTDGMNEVLNQSRHSHLINNYPPNNLDQGFRFEIISQIQAALEELYGKRGAQGLALRAGRACFKYGLHKFVPSGSPAEVEFRFLPLPTKISKGAYLFADLFNKYSDQRVRVEEQKAHILWHIDRCPICWQRQAEDPICHLVLGALQEALFWVSNGKFFNVDEILCIAKGDSTCTFLIDKTPLE